MQVDVQLMHNVRPVYPIGIATTVRKKMVFVDMHKSGHTSAYRQIKMLINGDNRPQTSRYTPDTTAPIKPHEPIHD